jgi:hypothetical protein
MTARDDPKVELSQEQRTRNAAILCCSCLRNIAFYRAGWHEKSLLINNEFWRRVNGNFLDTAIHDWYKLFADHKYGEHFWRRLFDDNRHTEFKSGLLTHIEIDEEELADKLKRAETYRDKFLAHLDAEPVMYLPTTEFIKRSIEYLLDSLLSDSETKEYLIGTGLTSAAELFSAAQADGNLEYENRLNRPPATVHT